MTTRSIAYAIVESRLGPVLVAATGRGVCLVRFGAGPDALRELLDRELPFARLVPDATPGAPPVGRWARELAAYVDGRSRRLDLPLDVAGSRFQRRVWDALRDIPRGETATYAALAERIGAPGAARAVARACAANPVLVAVPCHRVVPKAGGPGSYAGGAERKRALLRLESADPDARAPAAAAGPAAAA